MHRASSQQMSPVLGHLLKKTGLKYICILAVLEFEPRDLPSLGRCPARVASPILLALVGSCFCPSQPGLGSSYFTLPA
jgi:hypothetical protein